MRAANNLNLSLRWFKQLLKNYLMHEIKYSYLARFPDVRWLPFPEKWIALAKWQRWEKRGYDSDHHQLIRESVIAWLEYKEYLETKMLGIKLEKSDGTGPQ